MKTLSRYSLAAALTLGAAVFACPVQALQCPRQPFWRSNMAIDEAYERMTHFAARKVAEAQSIFKGRIIKVEFVGPNDEYPELILTYEVDQWLKGTGKQKAKIVYQGWCDGPCDNIIKMMDGLQSDNKEEIYIADHTDSSLQKNNPNIPADVDGIFGLCSRLGRSVEPIDHPQFRLPVHRKFLFDVVMVSEIEKLQSEPK